MKRKMILATLTALAMTTAAQAQNPYDAIPWYLEHSREPLDPSFDPFAGVVPVPVDFVCDPYAAGVGACRPDEVVVPVTEVFTPAGDTYRSAYEELVVYSNCLEKARNRRKCKR